MNFILQLQKWKLIYKNREINTNLFINYTYIIYYVRFRC